MKDISKERYRKRRKRYGYLFVVPRIIAIFCFVGQILVQSSLKFDKRDTSRYVDSRSSLSRLFSSSSLTARCLRGKFDLKLLYSSSAVVTIAIGLFRVFASYFAGKGKGRLLFFARIVEALDRLRLIPCIILSLKGSYPLTRSLTDFLVNGITHVLALALLIYSQFVVKEIHTYEVNKGDIKE